MIKRFFDLFKLPKGTRWEIIKRKEKKLRREMDKQHPPTIKPY